MGCKECNKLTNRKPRTNATVRQPARHGKALAFIRPSDMPLAEILDGAVCSPEVADLFDVGAPKYAKADENVRHAAAKALCRRCPVADACFADAYAHRSMGVYGGRVLDQGFWSVDGRKRAQGLVQSVQDVQDSPAC
jgi:hypothetical protein